MQQDAETAEQGDQRQPAPLAAAGELPSAQYGQDRQQEHRRLVLDDARKGKGKAIDRQKDARPEPNCTCQGCPAREQTASQQRDGQDADNAHQGKRQAGRSLVGRAQPAVDHHGHGNLAGTFGMPGQHVILSPDGPPGPVQDHGLVPVQFMIAQTREAQQGGKEYQRGDPGPGRARYRPQGKGTPPEKGQQQHQRPQPVGREQHPEFYRARQPVDQKDYQHHPTQTQARGQHGCGRQILIRQAPMGHQQGARQPPGQRHHGQPAQPQRLGCQ